MLLEPGIAGLSCQDDRYRRPNLSTLWFCGETIIKCVWVIASIHAITCYTATDCILKKNGRSWSIDISMVELLWFTAEELQDAPCGIDTRCWGRTSWGRNTWATCRTLMTCPSGFSIRVVEYRLCACVCLHLCQCTVYAELFDSYCSLSFNQAVFGR